jgi:septal ring factor EnvC (AmiA/AmiB activator)
MNLTEQLTQANAQIVALQEQANTATALTEQVSTLTCELATANDGITQLTSDLNLANTTITEHLTTIGTLTARVAELEASARTAEQLASEMVANLGMSTTPPAPVVTLSREDIINKYASLSGREQAAFYSENKAVILGK